MEQRTEWIEPDVAAERGIIRVVEDAEPLPHGAITNSYTGKVLECAGCIYEHPKERHHSVHYGASYWVVEVAEGYAPHLDYEKGVWAHTAPGAAL